MADFLAGGGPTSDTVEQHKKWGYIARLFFTCVNRENGTMQSLPFRGGVMDQPAKTLSVFETMQGLFMEHIKAQMDRK
jgi:hypothetical protein